MDKAISNKSLGVGGQNRIEEEYSSLHAQVGHFRHSKAKERTAQKRDLDNMPRVGGCPDEYPLVVFSGSVVYIAQEAHPGGAAALAGFGGAANPDGEWSGLVGSTLGVGVVVVMVVVVAAVCATASPQPA